MLLYPNVLWDCPSISFQYVSQLITLPLTDQAVLFLPEGILPQLLHASNIYPPSPRRSITCQHMSYKMFWTVADLHKFKHIRCSRLNYTKATINICLQVDRREYYRIHYNNHECNKSLVKSQAHAQL